jgi:hypothetical protein
VSYDRVTTRQTEDVTKICLLKKESNTVGGRALGLLIGGRDLRIAQFGALPVPVKQLRQKKRNPTLGGVSQNGRAEENHRPVSNFQVIYSAVQLPPKKSGCRQP